MLFNQFLARNTAIYANFQAEFPVTRFDGQPAINFKLISY
jgi:hypothetical protein